MFNFCKKEKNNYYIHLIHFFSALIPLIFGYFMEVYKDILPCKLCIMQRACFFAILFSSLLGLFLHKKYDISFISILFFMLCFIIALYNIALERSWIGSTTVCQNANGWLDKLFNRYNIPCNVPALEILGITLAEINLVYCAIIIAITSKMYLNCLKFDKKFN